MGWIVSKSFLRSFGLVAVMTFTFTTVVAGLAHIVSAHFSQVLYDRAIGDRILPEPPVYSWFGGPLWIALHVTWWYGLVAAPVVYVIVGGSHGDLRPGRVAVAAAAGSAASAFVLLAAAICDPDWRDGWGDAVLLSLLKNYFWAIGIGLVTTALLLRSRRFLALT